MLNIMFGNVTNIQNNGIIMFVIMFLIINRILTPNSLRYIYYLPTFVS